MSVLVRNSKLREFTLRVASWIVPLVLIGAGLLKISTEFTTAYHFGIPSVSGGILSFVGVIAISVLEIGLALWLIKFPASRLGWLIATAMFAVFCVVSTLEGLSGRQSCDCFGTARVWPYYAAVLDLLLAGVSYANLVYLRGREVRVSVRDAAVVFLLLLVFVTCSLGLFYVREATQIAKTVGLPQLIGNLNLDGVSKDTHSIHGTLFLATRARQALTIVGIEQNCMLSVSDEFPIIVDGIQSTSISVLLAPRSKGLIEFIPAVLLLDDNGTLKRARLDLRIHGRPG